MKKSDILNAINNLSSNESECTILNDIVSKKCSFYTDWLKSHISSSHAPDEHIRRIYKYNPKFDYEKFLNNIYMAYKEREQKKIYLESEPIYIDLEPYNLCSFKCLSCQSSPFERGNQLSEKIIDEILQFMPTAEHVELAKIGEIFMLPSRILPIIRKIRTLNPCIFMRTNTHGQTLNDEISETLVDVEFDLLSVSLDSDTKEGFKKFRNGDLDKVIENVKSLQHYKEKCGVKYPIVIVCSQLNALSDPLGICKIALDIGAKAVVFQNMVIYPDNEKLYQISNIQVPKTIGTSVLDQQLEDCYDFCHKNNISLAHPRTEGVGDHEIEFNHVSRLLSLNFKDTTCPTGDPWYRFCSNGNGEVSPCCYHSTFLAIKDNVSKGSTLLQVEIKEMRNHPAMLGLRKMLSGGEYSPNCFCWKKKQFSSDQQDSLGHEELTKRLIDEYES